jgi:small redox-active disulfide protein 2
MEIKVLGTGCAKCKSLEKLTNEVIAESKIEATVEKVEDIYKIMQFGVMSTPALVINQKVVLSGRLPSAAELKEILLKNQ